MSGIFCIYGRLRIVLSAIVKDKLHVVHEDIKSLVLVLVDLFLNSFEIYRQNVNERANQFLRYVYAPIGFVITS
jgi:hypothetical protein